MKVGRHRSAGRDRAELIAVEAMSDPSYVVINIGNSRGDVVVRDRDGLLVVDYVTNSTARQTLAGIRENPLARFAAHVPPPS